MTEINERYRKLAKQFDAKVTAVPKSAWVQPSPNPGWTVRDVVKHIVDTLNGFLGKVDRGAPKGPPVETDPVGAWRNARDAVQEALDNPEVAEQKVESMGQTVKWEELADGFLCFDLVMHAWDVARGAGIGDTLDIESVRHTTERAEGWAETGRKMGAFGPEVPVPHDADDQTRLLALLGRQA